MEKEDNDEILPPLYGNPKHFGQDKLFLDWILRKSSSSLMGGTKFQLFSLPALLYELARSSPLGEGGDRNRVPSLMVAEAQLERDTFMYLTETCPLHGEGQPGRYYCCRANVLGWSFILFSLVCPLYSLPLLEDSHRPHGYTDHHRSKSKVKSGVSFADLRHSKLASGPSTISSQEATEPAGKKADLNQKSSAVPSSYKQGSYSRTGSVASQVVLLTC